MDRPLAQATGRRALGLLAACALLALALSLPTVGRAVGGLLAGASALITPHPVWGALAFLGLSALSAMLAFFSTAAIVPVAVLVWGRAASVLLLWSGWILGGVTAFMLARWLGRPLVARVLPEGALARYGARISAHARLPLLVVFQLAIPSEIPGWLLGLARVPFLRYLAALALAELPYAAGTVLLGQAVVERRVLALVAVGAAGVALSYGAYRLLGHLLGRGDRAALRRGGPPVEGPGV